MALARWTPLRDVLQLQNEMNRLFSTPAAVSRQDDIYATAWTPQVDIFEDENGIRLHADLPGVEQKDLDVKVENGTLSLRGERRLAHEANKENYHRIERYFGTFSRSFALPDYADAENVGASFKNGVLDVTIPKRAEKRPKQIKIEVK